MDKKWAQFWQKLMSLGASARWYRIYRDLKNRYSKPYRFYHTLEHINHCLEEFRVARHWCFNQDVVEMAIWYHDAIYDPHRRDNEERSAKLAAKVSYDIGLPDFFIGDVQKLILATKHSACPKDPHEKILVDVDLAILGQSWEIFEKYERNIRMEYLWVPEEEYKSKRSSILKTFLARPTLYSTSLFRDKYETQARENLERSLALLGRGN